MLLRGPDEERDMSVQAVPIKEGLFTWPAKHLLLIASKCGSRSETGAEETEDRLHARLRLSGRELRDGALDLRARLYCGRSAGAQRASIDI